MKRFRVTDPAWPKVYGKVGIDCTPLGTNANEEKTGLKAYWLEFPGIVLNPDPDQHMNRSWFFESEVEEVTDEQT